MKYIVTMRFLILTMKCSFYCNLIAVSFTYGQATYYVSSSTGNDANNGTSLSTPWKTPNKVTRHAPFQAGDFILFKRGDIFQGEVTQQNINGTANNPIVFGAYGTGAKPIIYGDMTGATWTKTPGYDSIYQAFSGYFYSSMVYEDSANIWRAMKNRNQGDLHFYLNNSDSLKKLFNGLTPSSYGHGNDTAWVRTWDGNAPQVHFFHEANFIKGSYVTIQDWDIRNFGTAIKCLSGSACTGMILRNISVKNTLNIALFLSGHYINCIIESCTVDSTGYTAIYNQFGRRNMIRNNTVSNVGLSVLGIFTNGSELCGIGMQEDTACVAENNTFTNCRLAGIDTYKNIDDTVRYNTIYGTQSGIYLNGSGWVAHSNTVTTTVDGGIGIRVDIHGTGQTSVYNNTMVVKGDGQTFGSNPNGGTVIFDHNKITAVGASNTRFDDFQATTGLTSSNNSFHGNAVFNAGLWPNEHVYSTLATFQAIGYETGSTMNVSARPTISISMSSLSFGNVIINSISENTYTIQGSNLLPTSDSITITAPAGFTISTISGSDFASSKRISYTGGTLSATTIYVRFSPTAVQDYTGNITNAGGGAIQNVAVTGTGISATTAAITVNPTSLSFGDVIINTSKELTYALTGLNLSPASDSLTITASNGFTISTVSGSGFTSSKKIAYTSGTLQPIPKTIYVKFSPTAEQGYNATITNTGGSATTQIVFVSGNGSVLVPSMTTDSTSLLFGSVTINTLSPEKTYTLSGINLSPAIGNSTVTAPTGFQVSTTSGTGFDSTLTVAYSNSTLVAITIYVRFYPTAAQNYTGSIVHTGGSAAAESVFVSGSGVSTPDVVESGNGLSEIIQLGQNYPNPFNPITTISFVLPLASFTSLRIFDLLGREVTVLVSQELSAARYSLQWNAAKMPSGIYFYRLHVRPISSGQAGIFTETKKLVFLR